MGVSTHEMPPPPPPNVKCITRDAIFRCSLHRVAWDTLPVLIIRHYWLRLSPVTELLFSNSWFNKHGQAVVTSADVRASNFKSPRELLQCRFLARWSPGIYIEGDSCKCGY